MTVQGLHDAGASAAGCQIRLWAPDDDLLALTDLIHAAYAPHAAAGLRYWATHQTVEDTAQRLASGVAWVMVQNGRFVGTATLRPPQPESPVVLYQQPHVHLLTQFCVSPDHKGQGLGRRLYDHVEAHARRLGAVGMALDTARPAAGLIALYRAWGYDVVGACDWRPLTNYESVVMFKALVPGGHQGGAEELSS